MSPRISFLFSLVFHLVVLGGVVIFLFTAQDDPRNARFRPPTFSLVNSFQKMRSAISTPQTILAPVARTHAALESTPKPATVDYNPVASSLPREHSDSLSTILTALQSSLVGSGEPSAGGGENGKQENNVFDSKKLDQDLIPVYMPQVPYPQQVRDLEIEGTFEAVINVRNDGTVTGIQVLRSPHPLITSQATKTMMTWRFKPPTYKGQPVNARAIQVVSFYLN